MKSVRVLLTGFISLSLMACPPPKFSSMEEMCNEVARITCEKVVSCTGKTTQAECEEETKRALNCGAAKCPEGKQFNGDQAEECTNDYERLTCDAYLQTPVKPPDSCKGSSICE
jgi:hypothetical protein